jgi:hypothetical protein
MELASCTLLVARLTSLGNTEIFCNTNNRPLKLCNKCRSKHFNHRLLPKRFLVAVINILYSTSAAEVKAATLCHKR